MSQVGEKPDVPEVEDLEVEDVETPETEAEVEETEEEVEEDEEEEDLGVAAKSGAEEAVAKPKKGNPEYGALRKRAREAEERAAARERELSELRQAAQGRQTAEQRAIEEERLRLMPPEEKFEYLLKKQQQELDGRYRGLEFQMQDNADRVAFEALCARNPAFEAVREDVERQLIETRRGGGNVSREIAATYFIGKRALERAAKGSKTKQAAKGTQRVAAASAKPSGGRSDVKGGERRGGDERAQRAARLGDMEI